MRCSPCANQTALAQRLAVIRGEDDQRLVEQAPIAKRPDQTPDLGVQVGDLGQVSGAVERDIAMPLHVLVGGDGPDARVVRAHRQLALPAGRITFGLEKALPQLGRRIVGAVRILVVHPEEAAGVRLDGAVIEHRQGDARGVLRDALGPLAHDLVLGKVVVEEVEAPGDSRGTAQDEVPHHRPRAPAPRGELRRQGRCGLGDGGLVGEDAQLFGIAPRHQAAHRRKGDRRRRVGRAEDDALRSQGVQLRGEPAAAPVGAQLVGAQRIHADEEQQPRRLLPARRCMDQQRYTECRDSDDARDFDFHHAAQQRRD